jgi:mono/diheme cytochrome c family protein
MKRETTTTVLIAALGGFMIALPALFAIIGFLAPKRVVRAAQSVDKGVALYTEKVQPILKEQCSSCHGPEKARSGLRVDSRDALVTGGSRGPAIVPDKPDDSLLVTAIRQTGELKMPKGGKPKLSDQDIQAIADWIQAGAPIPVQH